MEKGKKTIKSQNFILWVYIEKEYPPPNRVHEWKMNNEKKNINIIQEFDKNIKKSDSNVDALIYIFFFGIKKVTK